MGMKVRWLSAEGLAVHSSFLSSLPERCERCKWDSIVCLMPNILMSVCMWIGWDNDKKFTCVETYKSNVAVRSFKNIIKGGDRSLFEI